MSNPVIQRLARLMKAKKAEGEKYVLLLGAGASIDSGIAATPKIMQLIVQEYGPEYTEGSPASRFNKLWNDSTPQERRLFLEKHLKKPPSEGYRPLAELIRDGYFDVVISFNFDLLLERSLKAIGFQDFRTAIRGETKRIAFSMLLRNPSPRVTVLKLHGSLESVDTFEFSFEEMTDYPTEIKNLLRDLTGKDIIICGYAFEDLAVQRAFAQEGGGLFCVNPAGVPAKLEPFMKTRRSANRVIRETFDDFFKALHRELTRPEGDGKHEPVSNPFKFLESHDESDRDTLLGRMKERQEILRALDRKPRVIHVYGAAKVGKTSLIRAAVMSRLDPEVFVAEYCRCRRDFMQQFSLQGEPGNLGGVLEQFSEVAGGQGKHCVLVLDQFEKVQRHFASKQEFSGFLVQLLAKPLPHLTVLFVSSERDYGAAILASELEPELKAPAVFVEPLPKARVGLILKRIARWTEIELEPALVEDLLRKYEANKTNPNNPFTLAHIQSVCHLVTLSRYGMKPRGSGLVGQLEGGLGARVLTTEVREALNLAINQYDLMSVLEDIRVREEKELIKEIMKIASEASRQVIAEYVRGPFRELMRESLTAETVEVK